ncbi:MAG: hypothetical protein IJW70_05680 [Clostridia bacterium]|nr:hypothetical protein [Clostridia bacterium]
MKKMLCMFLAMLMLASLLVACANSNDPAQDSQGEQTEQETGDPNYTDEVPALNFGDETITILSRDKFGVNDEFFAESNTDTQSDVVASAVYGRNMNIENRLGVTLEMLLEAEPVAKHSTAVKGGSSDYDIVTDSTYLAIQAVLKGEFVNLRDIQYIDLDKYYWTQGYNDIVSFGAENKQYLASGALALSMFRYMFVTVYNREVFESLGETDLYEVVKNGDWTLDYQNQIIADRYLDIGETPNKRDEKDMYGLITGDTVSVDPYCVAANVQLVSKNSDGEWFYNADQFERTVDLCEKVQALYNNSATYVFKTATYDDTGKTDIVEAFANGVSMMATVQVFALETNVGDLAEFDYGIAPMPKFDVNQENYATYVQDQVTAVGVSSSIADEDKLAMLGAVLECMASESYATVVDAYYSTALSYQYLQNPESKEMLDLIYNSLTFDFSGACSNIIQNNGGQSIRDQLRPLFAGKSTKLGSTLTKWQKSADKALGKINDFLADLEY